MNRIKNFLQVVTLSIISFNVFAADDLSKNDEFIPNKHIKQGIVTGIFYCIKNKESGNVLNFVDAHKGGGDLTDSYFIKNKESGNVLNFVDAHKAGGFLFGDLTVRGQKRENDKWDSHRLFSLADGGSDYYFIKNKESGYVLNFVDAHKGGGDLTVRGQKRDNDKWDSHRLFKFDLLSYKLNATIEDFQYDSMVYNLSSLAKNMSAVAWAASNQSSSTTDVHHPEIYQKIVNYSSWSFSKSEEKTFLNQLDVDVLAEYCGVKANAHNTTKWETKKTSLEESKKVDLDETVVSLKSTISVPPRKKVEYILTWEKVEADIPFKARVKFNGLADRLKKDGSVAPMALLDADGVMALLHYAGYKGTIISTDGKNVIAQVTGSVHVSGATKGIIDKFEYDL